jgi:hypothetical protein
MPVIANQHAVKNTVQQIVQHALSLSAFAGFAPAVTPGLRKERCRLPRRVCASVTQSVPRLHVLRAELKQNGCVKAVATAKFMERHE